MMLKPITADQLKLILTEMCSRVGVKYEDIDFAEEGWFRKHQWTEEEQENFHKWLGDRLTEWKCTRKGKYRGQPHGYYEASKFILEYGWMTSEASL